MVPAIASRRGLALAFVIALVLVGVLSYAYRTGRTARARQHFELGEQLMQKERYDEAIAQFRNALSISHGTPERLALAEALEKAGARDEAEIYFREVLRADPSSGRAYLGLARVVPEPQREQEYRRAIAGTWPDDAARSRIQARTELIEMLRKQGRTAQVQTELETQRQAWQQVLHDHPNAAWAFAGLGETELQLNDLPDAQNALRQAVKLDPENDAYPKRLQLVEHVLAIDPEVEGLTIGERYRRSRKLMEAALGALDQCIAGKSGATPDEVRSAADQARMLLLQHSAPKSYAEATATDIDLARQIWGERLKLCGQPGAGEEAISRAMTLVAH